MSGAWADLLGRLARSWLPRPWMVRDLTVPLLAYAAASAALAGWLRQRRGVRAAYTRKVFHFAVFNAAAALQLLWGRSAVVLFGLVVSALILAAVARGEGFGFYEALARPEDAPHRSLFILVPLATTAAGGVLANLLFPGMAYVGYAVAGWGDAVGEPVGSAWGRHPYRVPSLAGVPATRTLEGSAAVAVCGALAAAAGLALAGLPAGRALGAGAACGMGAAIVEAASHHGLDNLTVQVAAAGLAAWLV